MQTLTPTTPKGVEALAGKYLTFRLGDESYGIAVLKIREIIRFTTITPVPQMPPFVKGVINLRGKIIPVLGLRAKFGLSENQASERSCIIVVQVTLEKGELALMGLVVDAVEEVTYVDAKDIEETPDFGGAVDAHYVLGMAKVKDVVKALIDIDKIMTTVHFSKESTL